MRGISSTCVIVTAWSCDSVCGHLSVGALQVVSAVNWPRCWIARLFR